MILVDTNVLSELMRRTPDTRVLDWMDGLPSGDIGLTAISVAEMFDECFTGRIVAFDQLAAVEYAAIVLQRERIGKPISMPDAQIAAICRVSSAGLATRNTKDFHDTGLVLVNPWRA